VQSFSRARTPPTENDASGRGARRSMRAFYDADTADRTPKQVGSTIDRIMD